MKRGWTLLLAGALILAIALPATAKKPTPPTTTIPAFADCSFDAATGVLDNWHGQSDDDRTCVWTVDNSADTFRFQIQSDPENPVTKVRLPHLIVNDDIVFPSVKCFEAWQRSPQPLPFPADDDNLWTFSPDDHQCGAGPYLLTISIQALRSGSVNLVMIQAPAAG